MYSTTNGKAFEKPLTFDHPLDLWKVKSLWIPEDHQTISSLAHYQPFLKMSLQSVLNYLWYVANRQFHQIQLKTVPTSASLPLDISSVCKTAQKHILFLIS